MSKILSKEKIKRELERLQISKEISVDVICSNEPEMEPSQPQKRQTYLRVFALLLLVGREGEIVQFIKDGVCDEILPVVSNQDAQYNLFLSGRGEPLECFKKWKTHEREYFDQWQYRVSVPFFAPWCGPEPNEITVPHYTFGDRTILPWCARDTKSSSSLHSGPLIERNGGYGTVHRVRIDPRCHGFQGILEKVREATESWLGEFAQL
jgi:hypothetical protein